jgi:hypothetical protein
MPPSNNETAAAIKPEIGPDFTDQHRGQNKPSASDGDPGGEDEFAAALNLGSKLFNVLLEADDLLVGITIFLVFSIGHSHAAPLTPLESP